MLGLVVPRRAIAKSRFLVVNSSQFELNLCPFSVVPQSAQKRWIVVFKRNCARMQILYLCPPYLHEHRGRLIHQHVGLLYVHPARLSQAHIAQPTGFGYMCPVMGYLIQQVVLTAHVHNRSLFAPHSTAVNSPSIIPSLSLIF